MPKAHCASGAGTRAAAGEKTAGKRLTCSRPAAYLMSRTRSRGSVALWPSADPAESDRFLGPRVPEGEGGTRLKLPHILTLAAGVALLMMGGVAARAAQEATCPVSGHKVTVTDQTVSLTVNGEKQYFCCGGCPNQIVSNPQKYIKETRDPVSGQTFQLGEKMPHSLYKGVHYFFSSAENKKTFDADPDKYSNKLLSTAS